MGDSYEVQAGQQAVTFLMIQHSCLHMGEHQKCSKESAAVSVRLRSTLLSLVVSSWGSSSCVDVA